MLSFSIFQSYKAFNLRIISSQLAVMVEFSVNASNLVHELQKERGMTAGFIGSQGKNFADKIDGQRKLTNNKLETFNHFLSDFNANNISLEFAQNLDKLLLRLDQLKQKRSAINDLKLPLGEALAYYTGNNSALLSLIEQMSTHAPDQEMAIMISAYANYLQGKERAGIERAVMANTFSKNEFTGNLFFRFMGLVTTQKIYADVFLSLAKESDIAFYQSTMTGEFITETEKMRNTAMSSSSRTILTNELSKIVGYGGIIHRFKNYVLRGRQKDLDKINIFSERANEILDQYKKLPGITDSVSKEIETVRDVFNNYKQAAESVSEFKSEGKTIREIDGIVKINDGPALKAITNLSKGNFDIDPTYWFKMQTGKINLLKEVENHLAQGLADKTEQLKSTATFDLVTILLISLLGLLVSVFLSMAISKNLRNQIGGEPSDIEAIAKQIADGSLQINTNEGSMTGIYAAIMTMQKKLSEVIEKEIQNIVNAARNGDLSKRVEISNKSGFYKSLGEGINDLVDSSEAIITDTGRVFSSLSQGDLNQTITRNYQGSFNQLKDDANTTISKLKKVIEDDIQTLVNSTLQGDLSNRIVLRDKQGFFKDMSSGINQLVDSVNNIFNDASNAMDSMANGDLTNPIKNRHAGQFDELKNNINETMSNLEATITGLRDSSFIITSTSREISDGNNSLSSRTEHQASALEQTAASMEELTSTVKNNADNTSQANQLADGAKTTAVKGGEVMQQASVAMEEINQSSQKIAEIIGVIDEIAFQTNLLALNASVEAARAGEQGRGFAVVATEVRNLAGRSATAAKEIKELINDSVNKVEIGVKLVDQSTKNQNEIVESINRVGNIIAEISSASQEQSEGIEQVNTAVTSMDDATQQNAALAEETSAAAVSLSDQTSEMSKMMEFFTVSNSSSTRSPSVPAAPVKAVSSPAPATTKEYSKPVAEKAKAVNKSATNNSFDDEEWEEF
ncbi:MAG: hypothetical protein HOM14_11540 [Gammaproteobacteria bacterium]|nr:hypothetical protein [Gammaproteobacteria bacterium]MBT4077938.1 hypothetical protein [Gammaproteobacteria bacterium]MBT4452216.1 hypothetical protein [Gammaproteobacteria bacterium]MBT4862921.1 hypothetical protein [Gammaproteobacteria bacterium]MBT6551975.1 hypothetical protein [Gammaproteobacteria bacterium]